MNLRHKGSAKNLINFLSQETHHMSKPNERSLSDSREWFAIFCPPPCYSGGLQNGITFFLLGPCWVWKSMLDKSFHFVCFPKHFWSLSVSHPFYPLFSKNVVIFWLKFFISLIIGLCLNNHNLFQFEAFGKAKVCRSISNTQTFHFFGNFFGLSVSHQYTQF